MKRKLFAIMWVIIMAMILLSCTKEEKMEPTVACRDIGNKLVESATFEKIDAQISMGDELFDKSFEENYGISEKDVTDGTMIYSSAGDANEISILFVENRKNISKVKEALNNRIVRRTNDFNGYKPEEAEKLNNATVFVEGNYVCMVITENNLKAQAKIQEIINQ